MPQPPHPPHPPPPRLPVRATAPAPPEAEPDALPPVDLLARLLGGTPAALRAARRLLSRFPTLRRLAAAGAEELRVQGRIGRAQARRLHAAFALGRRVQAIPLARGDPIPSAHDVHAAFGPRLRDLVKERFLVVLLDGRNRVISEVQVSEGILTASLVHPREVFGPAIRAAAAAVVLLHNHPSGDPEPSPEDLEITRRLAAAGEVVGIRVVDHVVIGDGAYVSLLERGLLS